MTEEEVQNRLGELERRLAEVEKLLPALIRLAQSQQQRLEVISGVLLQSVTGNDLASPNIIGVNAGAVEQKRHVDTLDLVDVVAGDKALGQQDLALVVFLERGHDIVASEFKRDHQVG